MNDRPPGDKCEECGKRLEVGDEIVFTEDTERFWHAACFEASITPLPTLSKPSQ